MKTNLDSQISLWPTNIAYLYCQWILISFTHILHVDTFIYRNHTFITKH